MTPILHLQRLTPTTENSDANVIFVSSASSVCPTTLAAGEFSQFEIE